VSVVGCLVRFCVVGVFVGVLGLVFGLISAT
jgi:hypothetical protein